MLKNFTDELVNCQLHLTDYDDNTVNHKVEIAHLGSNILVASTGNKPSAFK